MNKRILVLGGTRYVGKRLVQLLLDRGDSVTVGTRGRHAVPFTGDVTFLKLDRFDRDSMQSALARGEWDVVYDQQCYSPEDAAITVEILKERVGRYVLCSTAAVYDRSLIDAGEELFDPFSYPIRFPGREAVDYGEGKRLSEAVLYQNGTFSTTSVRLPIILGPDDYTERLRAQVRRVGAGEPLKVLNPEARVGLVSSGEAAAFLGWLSLVQFTGPFNACSTGTIALREIVGLIEQATGKTATILEQPDEGSFSMFFARKSFNISAARAQSCGFTFLGIPDWLPPLVNDEARLCA